MTKVGKSDGEGTFAGVRGNDEVAPIPAVRRAEIERQGSLRVFGCLPVIGQRGCTAAGVRKASREETRHSRRGFRLMPGEPCGDHDVAAYLAQIVAMKRRFLHLAAER